MKYLLLIVMIAPLAGFAQNCSHQKDPKTGKEIRIGFTVLRDSAGKESAAVGFTKRGSYISLAAGAQFKTTNVHKSAQHMSLVVTFTDGSTRRFTGNKHTQLLFETGVVDVMFTADLTADDAAYFGKHTLV
ncbi:MAG TPA: hypothetical protein VHS53_14360, partial [Mucilaginibacter sp.]|nr:hypothetical protein [Mucilaginibacter sp.]